MKRPRLVMVGNGMAGVKTLEAVLQLAPDAFDITVFGAEPHGNYNRVLLSPVLAGEMQVPDILLNDFDWYRDQGITLHAGFTVTRIDRVRRCVHAVGRDGETRVASYDRLLLATGSTPFVLPVPGRDLPGVIAYRDIADTEAMIAAAGKFRHAVVIGAGLLGLEAANGLALRGMSVTVVHLADWIMNRQLDRPAAQMLQASLEARGLRFALGAQTESLLPAPDGSGRVGAVRLADGRALAADLVVMAAGIRPNVALAASAGLHCAHGIVVDDTLQTVTDPRVYAVGECAVHRGVAYGLVAPLFEQAKVCANHLAGFGIGRYPGSVTSTKLKVTGVDVFSAGDFMGEGADGEAPCGADGDAGCDLLVLHDPGAGIYRKLVLKNDRLIGAVMVGDTADSAWYFKLLRDGDNIAALRDGLMFGPRFANALAASSLPSRESSSASSSAPSSLSAPTSPSRCAPADLPADAGGRGARTTPLHDTPFQEAT